MSNILILNGYLIVSLVRAFWVAVTSSFIAYCFTDLSAGHPLLMIMTLVVTALFFFHFVV